MDERKLKDSLGPAIVVCHVAVAVLVVVLCQFDRFTEEEMTNLLAVISPTFLGLATAVVTYFVQAGKYRQRKGKQLSTPYVFLAYFLVGVYVLLTFALILSDAFAGRPDGQTTIMLFGVIESLVAGYVALIVKELFSVEA